MILADIGRFIGQKAVGAALVVAVVAAGVWCWQHPDAVRAFGHVVKLSIVWLVIAAALPWSSYLYMRPLLRLQSEHFSASAASGLGIAVIAAYCLIDILLAFWLAEWTITGAWSWFVLLAGFVAAGFYNFVICESLARHVET